MSSGTFRWVTANQSEETPIHKWHENYSLCKAGDNCVTLTVNGLSYPTLKETSCSTANAFICEDDTVPCEYDLGLNYSGKGIVRRIYHFG